MPSAPRDRLIFALDVPSRAAAERFISLLKGEVGLFKVGLELFVAEGPAFLQSLVQHYGIEYFLDLKFHDIPATVLRTQTRMMTGARLATIHVDSGREILKSPGSQVKLLGVTLLTHLGRDDLKAMGMAPEYQDPAKLVLLRAQLAQDAGCDGVVCAGSEAQAVKDACGPDFLVVCPAIRPAWSVVPGDDQSRITTPYDAIRAGADYLVVGRPIRQAADPAAAARRVVAEIARGLRDRGGSQ
jgi:orotidine-5'-phosphate decarboxylase